MGNMFTDKAWPGKLQEALWNVYDSTAVLNHLDQEQIDAIEKALGVTAILKSTEEAFWR